MGVAAPTQPVVKVPGPVAKVLDDWLERVETLTKWADEAEAPSLRHAWQTAAAVYSDAITDLEAAYGIAPADTDDLMVPYDLVAGLANQASQAPVPDHGVVEATHRQMARSGPAASEVALGLELFEALVDQADTVWHPDLRRMDTARRIIDQAGQSVGASGSPPTIKP